MAYENLTDFSDGKSKGPALFDWTTGKFEGMRCRRRVCNEAVEVIEDNDA